MNAAGECKRAQKLVESFFRPNGGPGGKRGRSATAFGVSDPGTAIRNARRAGYCPRGQRGTGESTTKWSKNRALAMDPSRSLALLAPSGACAANNTQWGGRSVCSGGDLCQRAVAISPARLWLRWQFFGKKWGYSPCPGGRSYTGRPRSCLRMRKPLRWSSAESRPKPYEGLLALQRGEALRRCIWRYQGSWKEPQVYLRLIHHLDGGGEKRRWSWFGDCRSPAGLMRIFASTFWTQGGYLHRLLSAGAGESGKTEGTGRGGRCWWMAPAPLYLPALPSLGVITLDERAGTLL